MQDTQLLSGQAGSMLPTSLWRKEIYPRRGSGGRAGSQQGKRKGAGNPQPMPPPLLEDKLPAVTAGSAGSGISRAQFAQLESGRNRTHPLGLRDPADWKLAQKMASAQEESQSPKRLHPLRFPSDSIFEVTQ